MAVRTHEIVIAGAGPVGLAAAIACRQELGSRTRVMVCDPNLRRKERLIRTYAISHGPMRLLENIGVWGGLNDVQPIARMEITDSALADIIRQRYLSFESKAEAGDLAYMVTHEDLMDSLWARAANIGVEFRQASVASLIQSAENLSARLSDESDVRTALLVASDGGASPIRDLLHIAVTGWSYERTAIVATVQAEAEHGGAAIQHFLPAGTFALLPLTNRKFSIVWVEKPDDADRICALPPAEFMHELQTRAGHDFGQLTLAEEPQTFPLRLQLARRSTAARAVLIGDAAHLMHPLAGQGLNLGLADVGYLVEALRDELADGGDLGSRQSLAAYERSRIADTAMMLGLTDALFRLFTPAIAPVRLIRDAGLAAIDRLPSLKDRMIAGAGGASRRLPDLLR